VTLAQRRLLAMRARVGASAGGDNGTMKTKWFKTGFPAGPGRINQ
jgi:hypothetical protein